MYISVYPRPSFISRLRIKPPIPTLVGVSWTFRSDFRDTALKISQSQLYAPFPAALYSHSFFCLRRSYSVSDLASAVARVFVKLRVIPQRVFENERATFARTPATRWTFSRRPALLRCTYSSVAAENLRTGFNKERLSTEACWASARSPAGWFLVSTGQIESRQVFVEYHSQAVLHGSPAQWSVPVKRRQSELSRLLVPTNACTGLGSRALIFTSRITRRVP